MSSTPKDQGYTTPDFSDPVDLHLNANESIDALADLSLTMASLDADLVRRYPDHQALQSALGQWLGVAADRIVVTAGGDESIDRVIRTLIDDERQEILTHAPTFEMVRIYAQNHGGRVVNVPWLLNDFPVEQILQHIGPTTAAVVLTSPNNPTGRTIDLPTIVRLCQAADQAGAKALVDLAYVEFAEDDPTETLAALPNVLMVRTFSKAWGLAGLRVGYLVADSAEFATTIRNAAGPYPVSAVSLQLAFESLTQRTPQMQVNVERIKSIRELMFEALLACGGEPVQSGGNYLFTRFDDHQAVWSGLAKQGIGVRKFVNKPDVSDYLRITCPSTPGDYWRLLAALERVTGVDLESDRTAAGMVFKPELVSTETTPEPGSASLVKPLVPEDKTHSQRTHSLNRVTKETRIQLTLDLDGSGRVEVSTGIGFLDHMLTALAFHAGIDLELTCEGDVHVDDHHTSEDCALALGTAIDAALGPRKGIRRFGYAYAPLDEALARSVVDLSGRPWPEIHLDLQRPMIGQWACENITHFFQSLAMTLKCSMHIDVLRGSNDHHRAEAAFKSLAKALKEALTQTSGDVPSTKGVL